MKKKIVIIGSGINGLVAANYLQKSNFDVTVLEKKDKTGGACTMETSTIGNQKVDYAHGATVLGMMQKFIFEETGLKDEVTTFYPKHPKLVYFQDSETPTRIFQDVNKLKKELKDRWDENGDINLFRNDENKVISFLRNIYKNGLTPSIELANSSIGKYLTDLWIKGSAIDLLNHYFNSEKTKLYMGMTVIESGPVSLHEKGTAINIAIMDSGSIFDGYWGFVKKGIWKISEKLTYINSNIGVRFELSSLIKSIDANDKMVSYSQNGNTKRIGYDYLFFATDPLTPSKILQDKPLIKKLEQKDWLGSSGKITLFFKNNVRWKYSDNNKLYDTSFRFIFLNNTLDELERNSQNSKNNVYNYNPGYIQIYPEGAAQRKMGNNESIDKLILFTKSFSLQKRANKLNDHMNDIIKVFLKYIENPQDLIHSEFISPKDLQEIFFFPEGNIDHLSLSSNQNFEKRSFSNSPKNNFFKYYNYEDIYYCGAGSFPCGSVAGTPGYMSTQQLLRNLK